MAGVRAVCAGALLAAAMTPPAAVAGPGLFSSTGLEGWMERRFAERAHAGYRLKRSAGVRVLEADCKMGASGWHWDAARVYAVVRTGLAPWEVRSLVGAADVGAWREERRDPGAIP